MSEEIRYLGDVRKLSLKDGDIVVIECEDRLNAVQRKNITEWVESVVGNKVLVLDYGIKIGVLSKDA